MGRAGGERWGAAVSSDETRRAGTGRRFSAWQRDLGRRAFPSAGSHLLAMVARLPLPAPSAGELLSR